MIAAKKGVTLRALPGSDDPRPRKGVKLKRYSLLLVPPTALLTLFSLCVNLVDEADEWEKK